MKDDYVKKPIISLNINRRILLYLAGLTVFIAVIVLSPTKAIQSVMGIINIRPLDNKTIVIDPGHGGIDGGTNMAKILEKDINLEIGLRLKDILVKKGANVIMTREMDESLDDKIIGNSSRHREDLEARVKIVSEANADILLSIHVNYSKNPKKIGPIVYYQKDSVEGNYLAEHMQEYLNDISTYKEINVTVGFLAKPGDYYILRNTEIPGIIVEVGFISNETDIKLLLDAEHQNDIVEKITKGIIVYFKDKNS